MRHHSPAWSRSLVLRSYLRHLARGSKPIVIGPFRSELGFEVLYWLPLVQWALKRYGIAPERCIALSRGGMGALYPAAKYVDLYALRTVDQVRMENQVDYEVRHLQKQTSVTAWDRRVAAEAAEGPHRLFHPSWMYWLFEGFWDERDSVQVVGRHTEYVPMPAPMLPEGLVLPKDFVAVRFYERHTLPFSEPIRQVCTQMVQALASRYPVVVLNQPGFFDDHVDLPVAGPNVFALPVVDAAQNFLLQAAVLARAQAFVGTYGGMAQWALRYGKPSLSLVSQWTGTAAAHQHLSRLIATKTNTPFEVLDLRVAKLYEAAILRVATEPVAA